MRTGRRADAATESGEDGDINCRPGTLDSEQPQRPSAHIEMTEISKLVLIPAGKQRILRWGKMPRDDGE